MRVTPLKSLRKHCRRIGNGQWREVKLCPATGCASYPYRSGHKPADKPALTVLKSIRARCLDCSCFNTAEVRRCWNKDCFLYPYRMGHNPALAGRGNVEALRRYRERQDLASSADARV